MDRQVKILKTIHDLIEITTANSKVRGDAMEEVLREADWKDIERWYDEGRFNELIKKMQFELDPDFVSRCVGNILVKHLKKQSNLPQETPLF